MKRGCDVVGLPVICLDEGCKAIEVKDILYNSEDMQVIGFLVDEGGYFHTCKMIYFQNVKSIGTDAMVIQSQDMIKNEKRANGWDSWQRLIGVEVMTEEGQNVGIVQDIIMDATTGKLTGLILSEGLFHDLVEGRSVLPLANGIRLNTSTIIISSASEHSILSNTGGLKKMLDLE
ncbi:PRC-barrel domain-containing protein [Thermotalea metallivorans]|uniref:PRC-barrel domain-containing protein n=1 Tax=Thermotalea metallivorans TaxID=520762 RepID=A0A140L0H0_9FIRM|nr:PRC-barrel domain-containing protein [Thermotalea metallivorans]KXG74045.1 hypothetical protein AN619_26550 [Thermotalea metallivorans]